MQFQEQMHHVAPSLRAIEVAPNIASRSTVPDATDAAHAWLHATLRLLTFRIHIQPHKDWQYDGQ